jgi:DNA-binding response OmpR family regulator
MKWKIVIADDDPSVLEIFQIIFEKAGYETTTLSNPKPLLQNQYIDADIFLLDKQMSGADGIEICKHLKQNECTRDKPVLIISANPNAKALSEEAGADDFIEKPFLKKDLLAKVDRILQRTIVCEDKM